MAENYDSSSDEDKLVIKTEVDDNIQSNSEVDEDKTSPNRTRYVSNHCRLCQCKLERMADTTNTDNDKSFLCQSCREHNMKNDDVNAASNAQHPQHVCFFCQKNFPDKFSLSVHLLSLHQCAYWCHICMEAFSYKSVYLVHLRNHKIAKHSSENSKKSANNMCFKCDFCRKTFSHQRYLDGHRKKHLLKQTDQSTSLNGNEQSPLAINTPEPVRKKSRKGPDATEDYPSAEYHQEESYIKSEPVDVTSVQSNMPCLSSGCNLNNELCIKSEPVDVTPVQSYTHGLSAGCNLNDDLCIKSEPVDVTPIQSDMPCPSSEYNLNDVCIKSEPVDITSVQSYIHCPSSGCNLNDDLCIKSEPVDETVVQSYTHCLSSGCNLNDDLCIKSEPVDETAVQSYTHCPSSGCNLNADLCIKSEPIVVTPVESKKPCPSAGCNSNDDSYIDSTETELIDTSLTHARKRYPSPGFGLGNESHIKSQPADTDWSSGNENCPSAGYNLDTPCIKSELVDNNSSIHIEVNQDYDSEDAQYFEKPKPIESRTPVSSSYVDKVVEVVDEGGRDLGETHEHSFTNIVEKKNLDTSAAITVKALNVTDEQSDCDQNTSTSIRKKHDTQRERGGIAVNFIKQFPFVLKKKDTETDSVSVNVISTSDKLTCENVRKLNPKETKLNLHGVTTVSNNYGDMYIESKKASEAEIIPTVKSKNLPGNRVANVTKCPAGQADGMAVNCDSGYRTISKQSTENGINREDTIPFRVNLINSNNPKPVEGTFDCPQCHVKFNSEEMFRTHWKLHGIEKRFRCDLCNQPFSRNITLVRHRRTHFK